MTRTVLRTLVVAVATLIAAVSGASAEGIDCGAPSDKFSTTVVKYFEDERELPPASQRDETAESICNIRTVGNRRICTVRLWGTLHRPLTLPGVSQQFPTLIFNHGSEPTFRAKRKYCDVARYFVPKGYAVFVPFRRGQGDAEGNRLSSGRYIEDVLDDFASSPIHHRTTCLSKACYKAQLLELEADEEVALAAHFLTVKADLVARQPGGDFKLAVGGNSYGGAVTVFFNRKNHGQKVVMPFAPAAQNWGIVDFTFAAQAWDLSLERDTLLGTLLQAANNAKQPAFYLQAKWDYDTRATIDLAYAHAYGSSDPTHGNRFMASIFPYEKVLVGGDHGDIDYQHAHGKFAEDTAVWGRSVLAFLKLYGVK